MNTLKQFALSLLKPFLRPWITDRALKIPLAQRPVWAKRLKINEETLDLVESMFQDQALAEFDKIKF